jgi:hypothetical protein
MLALESAQWSPSNCMMRSSVVTGICAASQPAPRLMCSSISALRAGSVGILSEGERVVASSCNAA